MTGFRKFAAEWRKKGKTYSDPTSNHIAIYAMVNDRLYIIDDQTRLADLEIHDLFAGNYNDTRGASVTLVGYYNNNNAKEGSSVVFDIDGAQKWKIDTYVPATSGTTKDYQLRLVNDETEEAHLSLRTDGTMVVGISADTITTSKDFYVSGDAEVSGTLVLSTGTSINEFSTDGTMSGDSDDAVPTEKAVKTYVDNQVVATGGGGIQSLARMSVSATIPQAIRHIRLLTPAISAALPNPAVEGEIHTVTNSSSGASWVTGDILSLTYVQMNPNQSNTFMWDISGSEWFVE